MNSPHVTSAGRRTVHLLGALALTCALAPFGQAEQLLVTARLSGAPACPAGADRCYDTADIGRATATHTRHAATDPGYPGVVVEPGGEARLRVNGRQKGQLGTGVLVRRQGVLVPLNDIGAGQPDADVMRVSVRLGPAPDATGRYQVNADVTLDNHTAASTLHMLPGRWYVLAHLPGSDVIQLRLDAALQ